MGCKASRDIPLSVMVIMEGKSYKFCNEVKLVSVEKVHVEENGSVTVCMPESTNKTTFIHLFSDLCMREEEEHGPHLNRISNDGSGPSLDRF